MSVVVGELISVNKNLFALYFASRIMTLSGHTAEISNCIWNFDCSMIATSSIDATARLWDFRTINTMHVIDGHQDEVLDVCFDYVGKRLATASNDCTCKVWNLEKDFRLMAIAAGHSDEVSKVRFSPAGHLLLTASGDRTARTWSLDTGFCSQILAGHTADVFSCAFNYAGNIDGVFAFNVRRHSNIFFFGRMLQATQSSPHRKIIRVKYGDDWIGSVTVYSISDDLTDN